MTSPSEQPRFNPQQYGHGQTPPPDPQGRPVPPLRPPAQQPWHTGPQQALPQHTGPQRPLPPQPTLPGQSQGHPVVRKKGLFGALLDTKFDAMVTPMLIRGFYLLSLTVITLQCLFFLILGVFVIEKDWGWAWGVMMVVGSPLVWLLESLGVRMTLEFVINQFKITEELQKIRRNTSAG